MGNPEFWASVALRALPQRARPLAVTLYFEDTLGWRVFWSGETAVKADSLSLDALFG